MSRRSRGSVRHHKGVFYAIVTVGTDSEGRPVRPWHRADPNTREAAEKLLTEKLHELDQHRYATPSTQSTEAFLTRWLEAHKPQVRANSWAGYESKVRLHIVPRIGSRRLQDLTTSDLNTLYGSLAEYLSEETVKQCHGVLRRAFADAELWGDLAKGTNPAAHARPPRHHTTVEERLFAPMRTWESAELAKFLGATRNDRDYPLWHLAAFTGMRRSELMALCWDMVDLDAGIVSVRRTVTPVEGEVVWGEPKTKRSQRDIALADEDIAVLREWKARQNAERLAAGQGWNPDWKRRPTLFCLEDGTLPYLARPSRRFGEACKRVGVANIGMHGLRHTHATLLIKAGVDVHEVSTRLGHASTAFTMDRYTHSTTDSQRRASGMMHRLVEGL